MGYIKHHVIVVIGWNPEQTGGAREKAVEIFGGHSVTDVLEAQVNGYCSFMVGPDGSKEGWEDSDKGNENREAFIAWLNSQRYPDKSSSLDWSEIVVGSDDGESYVGGTHGATSTSNLVNKEERMNNRTLAEHLETQWVEADPQHPNYDTAVRQLDLGESQVIAFPVRDGTDWWTRTSDGHIAYSSPEHHRKNSVI